jgi:hypothetical protein
MGINSTEVTYGFGQMGSAYVAATNAYAPPVGKIVVAITMLDVTGFTTLTGDTAQYANATGSIPTGATNAGTAFVQSTSVEAQGTNDSDVADSVSFPKGITIFGRWTVVTPKDNGILVYLADL